MTTTPRFATEFSAIRSRGYTLLELTIVIAILSVIAAIAVPTLTADSARQLELAAHEFAAAIRFARSEARRTNTPHGFQHVDGEHRIRVFRLDTATTPSTIVYDVYNPVDKQPYDVDLQTILLAKVDSVTRNTLYSTSCTTPGTVTFDRNGTPWCQSPEDVLLRSLDFVLLQGAVVRTVTLDGITGRVTLQ